MGKGANTINRENVSRLIVVAANAQGRDLRSVVNAVALTGSTLSIASLVGFVTLFGVATRNGLLLVDNYNTKFAQGMPVSEILIQGSMERLNAIFGRFNFVR
jgi:Cu/Ag efflux pump CusA